jgi:alkylhydroperoxidase family enzyme
VIRDPAGLALPPREEALAGMASLLTEAPWTVDAGDLARMRAAGLSDEGIVQAVTIAAIFNHLTRAADATGLRFDYATELPPLAVDRAREPVPRPPPAGWPAPEPRLPLSLRPATAAAVDRWAAYVRAPSPALPARDRAVLGRAAAFATCDAAGVSTWGDATPRSPREAALAAFAEKLTVTPWRMSEDDLAPLRGEGLDDRGVLDVVGVVGFQNMSSRLRLALG